MQAVFRRKNKKLKFHLFCCSEGNLVLFGANARPDKDLSIAPKKHRNREYVRLHVGFHSQFSTKFVHSYVVKLREKIISKEEEEKK